MSTRREVPSLLNPYLPFPRELALILLTSTLGSSTTWLTARFIGSALTEVPATDHDQYVVLVTWIRDDAFWKTELKRATGLDGVRLSSTHRVTCIDALTASSDLTRLIPSISTAIQRIQQHHRTHHGGEAKILLVLDSPDICLATASITAIDLSSLLLSLRRQVWATVLTCSSGLPLVAAATTASESRPTPIETECAAFITTQAHAADLVMSARELETGAAKDISGVLRITRGGKSYDSDGIRETEMLYLVQRDGNVKAFARGADVHA